MWMLLCLSALPYVSYAAAGASWPREVPVVAGGGGLELGSTLRCVACCKAKKPGSSWEPNCKATFSQPAQVCAEAPGVVRAFCDAASSSSWHSQSSWTWLIGGVLNAVGDVLPSAFYSST